MWAHSGSGAGRWQPFSEHARSTGALSERFASEFGAGRLGLALGLFHDAGKCRACWQQGLLRAGETSAAVGVPHKDLGTRLLVEVAGVAALAILGHHGGMTDLADLHACVEDATAEDEVVERFFAEVPEAQVLAEGVAKSLMPASWRDDVRVAEMGVRLAFSALVDADHMDTSAHFHDRLPVRPRPDADMAELLKRFDAVRASKFSGKRVGWLNEVRERVYQDAIAHAAGTPGMYRMSAPTGVGKTLAAAGFGLHHAMRTGKKRVIVAVPFITVTEQNATVYRDYLGDEVVLEHHSAVEPGKDDSVQWRGAVGVR